MGALFGLRPPYLIALGGGMAAVGLWLAGDPAPPAPRTVAAAPSSPPALVDTLASGQTLSDLWQEHGLDPKDLPAVVDAGEGLVPWRQLRPGAIYRFALTPEGELSGVDLKVDRDRRLVVTRRDAGFVGRLIETRFTRRTRAVHACIDSSPWEALSDAGEDPTLTVEMAEVLAAQIDFYTDIHAGDCMAAVMSVDERPDGSYRVVSLEAMRIDLSEKTHEVYRYAAEGERDWYDPEGRSLKRRFLRSPLKFTRVSSGFGMRVHPITRRRRAHNGVDYVAPVGTPVQASGGGVVMQAGRNGGHGVYIKLDHGESYSTSYSHLSRIADGIRRGTGVEQGQVIGYVGSTGMSTGAHLDYRFMKDGRYVDPLSTDLPTAIPLEGAVLADFQATRGRLEALLDGAAGHLASPLGAVPSAR